jgi:hypothetical protein
MSLSASGADVLVAHVLLVEALVMRRLGLLLAVERLVLVLDMTGLQKRRRAPIGAPCGRVDGFGRMAGANPVVLQVSLRVYPPITQYKRGYLPACRQILQKMRLKVNSFAA